MNKPVRPRSPAPVLDAGEVMTNREPAAGPGRIRIRLPRDPATAAAIAAARERLARRNG